MVNNVMLTFLSDFAFCLLAVSLAFVILVFKVLNGLADLFFDAVYGLILPGR
jgi:hypothetical protein